MKRFSTNCLIVEVNTEERFSYYVKQWTKTSSSKIYFVDLNRTTPSLVDPKQICREDVKDTSLSLFLFFFTQTQTATWKKFFFSFETKSNVKSYLSSFFFFKEKVIIWAGSNIFSCLLYLWHVHKSQMQDAVWKQCDGFRAQRWVSGRDRRPEVKQTS